mgnify:CR=1
MKDRYFTLGLLTAILVIFIAGANTTESNRRQWEYAKSLKSVNGNYIMMVDTVNRYPITDFDRFTNKYGESLNDEINMLKYAGENGWELITVDSSGNWYFKRQK